MKRAVFLDRDGVINEVILKDGKPFSPRKTEEFKFVEGIKNVLSEFRKHGFLNIIVTNQPDIGRGLMSEELLNGLHAFLEKSLPIDDIFVCPHDDMDNCDCRKPKPGMLLEAAKKWEVSLKDSFFIGDQQKDVGAGKKAGCVTILIDRDYNEGAQPEYRVKDIKEALNVILNKERNR